MPLIKIFASSPASTNVQRVVLAKLRGSVGGLFPAKSLEGTMFGWVCSSEKSVRLDLSGIAWPDMPQPKTVLSISAPDRSCLRGGKLPQT
jgi:hypothetical protein